MSESIALASLAALGTRLELPIGLVLDEIEVQTDRATFVEGAFRLGTPGRVTVRISETSLETFVRSQLPPLLREPKLRFVEGLLHVTATVKVLVEVTATARLKVVLVGEEELHLELVDVDKPGPVHGIVEKQIENLNPVFKTSDVPIPLAIERVDLGESLDVFGRWNLPERSEA